MFKKGPGSFWMTAMFYTTLQRVSLFVFGVLAYMILVRGLSTENNGIWALYITLFSLFEVIKQGLLRNATIKFLALTGYSERRDEVQSSSLLVNAVFSLLAILFILLAGHLITHWLKAPSLFPLLSRSILLILLMIPFHHCEILLQSAYRFNTLFTSALIRQGFFFTGIVILYFFYRSSFTLDNILLLQIAALTMTTVYIVWQSRKELLQKVHLEMTLTWKIFHFGKYTFGTNLFAGLSRSFDHFMTAGLLGSDLGKNYVAYYNTVTRINNMVDVPSLAAADVLYPKNVEALEKQGIDKVKYYFEQVTGTILALIIPLSLFIFIFPKFIIYIIAGPEYYPAIVLLQMTILFSMVRPLSYQFGSTLDAIGKPHVNFTVNMLLMLVNLLLTWLLIKVFGGIGAAYATMISYTLSFMVMLYILKKYVRINFSHVLRYGWTRYTDIWKYLLN